MKYIFFDESGEIAEEDWNKLVATERTKNQKKEMDNKMSEINKNINMDLQTANVAKATESSRCSVCNKRLAKDEGCFVHLTESDSVTHIEHYAHMEEMCDKCAEKTQEKLRRLNQ